LTNPKFGEVERVDYGRYKHAIDVDVENKNNFDIDGVCASLAGKDELSPVPLWKANVNFGGDNKSQGRIQAGSKRRVTLQLLMLKEDAYTFRSECNSCFFYNVDDYNLYSVWYGEQLKGLFRFYLDHKDNRRGLSVGITVNSVYTSDTHYSAVNGCSDGSFQLKRPVDKFLTVIKYKR
jgi:hypothetical protein